MPGGGELPGIQRDIALPFRHEWRTGFLTLAGHADELVFTQQNGEGRQFPVLVLIADIPGPRRGCMKGFEGERLAPSALQSETPKLMFFDERSTGKNMLLRPAQGGLLIHRRRHRIFPGRAVLEPLQGFRLALAHLPQPLAAERIKGDMGRFA